MRSGNSTLGNKGKLQSLVDKKQARARVLASLSIGWAGLGLDSGWNWVVCHFLKKMEWTLARVIKIKKKSLISQSTVPI
jgi:hypothetical protein